MSGIDLKTALDAARIAVAALQPRPPRWLLDHVARLEWSCASATDYEAVGEESELIGSRQAAAILRCSEQYIRSPKMTATLDGHRIGHRWIFDKKVVETYAVRRTA